LKFFFIERVVVSLPQHQEEPAMEYLVTMTTHVPDGTPDQAVDDVRAREAAHSRELAAAGHLLRLWRLPGRSRALGLWTAGSSAEMQAILGSLPMDPWMTVETTPLRQHPIDPALIVA
jgi:muconolactone D-isomerase